MQHSQPGRKLSPELKLAVDRIYQSDPHRYARLVLWIWRNQRLGRSDETLLKAIFLAGNYIHGARDWWKYLTSLLPQASASAHDRESQDYKMNRPASIKEILVEVFSQVSK